MIWQLLDFIDFGIRQENWKKLLKVNNSELNM